MESRLGGWRELEVAQEWRCVGAAPSVFTNGVALKWRYFGAAPSVSTNSDAFFRRDRVSERSRDPKRFGVLVGCRPQVDVARTTATPRPVTETERSLW